MTVAFNAPSITWRFVMTSCSWALTTKPLPLPPPPVIATSIRTTDGSTTSTRSARLSNVFAGDVDSVGIGVDVDGVVVLGVVVVGMGVGVVESAVAEVWVTFAALTTGRVEGSTSGCGVVEVSGVALAESGAAATVSSLGDVSLEGVDATVSDEVVSVSA